MADDKKERKQDVAPKSGKPGISGFLAEFQQGLGASDIGAVNLSSAAIREAIERMQVRPLTTAEQARDLEPAALGDDGKKQSRRPPNRTALDRIPGRRPMKEYPLIKSELWTLGGIQAGSAVSFSLAGNCFGLWSSTKQQLAFAKGADPNVAGYWRGVGDMAFYGMIGLAVIGAALFLLSGFNVLKIIWMTEHRK